MIKVDNNKHRQIATTVAIVFSCAGMAVYRAINPSPGEYQAMVDLHFHPIASVLGAVLPSFVLAPLTYWAVGRTMPRLATWGQSVKRQIFKSLYAVTGNWKAEHRAGLVAASLGGATLAVAIGYITSGWSRWGLANWLAHHSGDAIIWAIIGAFVIGTAVYCHRAFSAGYPTNGEVSERPSENGPATCLNSPTKEGAANRDANSAQPGGPNLATRLGKLLDDIPVGAALSLIGGVAVASFVAFKAIMGIAPPVMDAPVPDWAQVSAPVTPRQQQPPLQFDDIQASTPATPAGCASANAV